ncbi:hypothetical protein SEA_PHRAPPUCCINO_35 [Mycobacterium phage Phrappuccino]|uniref:DUF2637 domain-containing protein n=1 Tax=Mycobacterium phage Phrappuccino TaxID=2591223 RepID=A0A514DDL5_9CAUD|nr:hypothetical protein KHQ87_gp035 [Mycobacterium phage Phrappuccino]QDH91713.1 hypothetical protein SEA_PHRAPPUCCINO_35 [Mycobacterium phage Phrappuccino]QIQ63343.1 hypothetical protein SEA_SETTECANDELA_35 [Mycobacterium phage Settecandela]
MVSVNAPWNRETEYEDPRDAIIRRNGWALSWLATIFGITIIACHIESGKARWSSSVWEYALQVPGSPATWGFVILASGLMLLYGNRDPHRQRIRNIGYWIGFWWFCALDATAMLSLIDDLVDADPLNIANPLAVISWTYVAYIYRERVDLSKSHAEPIAKRLLVNTTEAVRKMSIRAGRGFRYG